MANEAEDKSKVYFSPGDTVRVNKEIEHRPIMYVLRKESSSFRGTPSPAFIGIRCRWFDKNHQCCEAVFDTKDLEKY